MAELRGLFLNDESAEKHSFSFIAGFHVGFPLAVLQTKGAAGWLEIRDLLFKTFSESSKKFHVISSDYDPETIFPLGKPLIIQYDNFIEDICFISDLEALGVPVKSDKYKLDHLIWICSSGIVLLMWKISTNDERLYRKLRSTIYDNDQYDPSKHYYTSQRYVDLANIFIQISQIVRNAVSTPNLAFLFETSKHVDEFQRACLLLDNLAGFNVDETVQIKHLSNAIKKEKNNRILFEELLIDVYYIEVNQCATDNDFQIGYIESILNTKDPQYILTTAAIYSSFVGFLWLRRYLAEELESLQQILASEKTMRGEFLSRISR